MENIIEVPETAYTPPPNLDTIDVHLHLSPAEYEGLLRESRFTGLSLSDELRARANLSRPPEERSSTDGITVITWMNKPDLYRQLVLGALHPNAGFQKTSLDVQFIAVEPAVGCRNIGEAYEIARGQARHKTIVYVHQDAYPVDWTYLEKVWSAHRSGIMATGIIGCVEDTGGAWFHGHNPGKMSGFIDMGTGRIIGYEDREVSVVDGLVFTCSADLEWSTDYEGPHMAIEDMCMQVREAGGEVWNLSTQFMHLSPGSTDESFWRSVETFRNKWAHRLPASLPSVEDLRERTYRERASMGLDMEGKLTKEGRAELLKMKRETNALLGKPNLEEESSFTRRDRERHLDEVRARLQKNNMRSLERKGGKR